MPEFAEVRTLDLQTCCGELGVVVDVEGQVRSVKGVPVFARLDSVSCRHQQQSMLSLSDLHSDCILF